MRVAQSRGVKHAGYNTLRDGPAKSERTTDFENKRALLKFRVSRLLLCTLLLGLSVVTVVTSKSEGTAWQLDLSLVGVYVSRVAYSSRSPLRN